MKRVETRRREQGDPNFPTCETQAQTAYYVHSSVLGAKVVELNAQGQKVRGHVYAGGRRLAEQGVSALGSRVTWRHENAATNSWVEVFSTRDAQREEMDPLGAEVGLSDPYESETEPTYSRMKDEEPIYEDSGYPFDYSGGCRSVTSY